MAAFALYFFVLERSHGLFEVQDDFLESALRLEELLLLRRGAGAGAGERRPEPTGGDPAARLESKAIPQAPPFLAQVPCRPSLGPSKNGGLPLRGPVGPGEAAGALRPARLVVPRPLEHAGNRLLILPHD